MATKTKRIKSAAAAVPQTRDEVASDIRRLGDIQRKAARMNAEMNDKIAAITEAYSEQLTPLDDEFKRLTKRVQAWCEANRNELTEGGKTKTASLITGEIQWRNRPPSVTVRGAETVLKTLRRLGLERFIRIKEEINKDAILNEPTAIAGIAGIKINTGLEDFSIIPFEQTTGI